MTVDYQESKVTDIEIAWSSASISSDIKPYLSMPELIEFPTEVPGQTAYAYFYPPTNPIYQSTPQERPPLLLKSHGVFPFLLIMLIWSFFASSNFLSHCTWTFKVLLVFLNNESEALVIVTYSFFKLPYSFFQASHVKSLDTGSWNLKY